MPITYYYLKDFNFLIKKLNILIALFLLIFISFNAYSQEYIYKNFGVNDGLPSSEVYKVYQDKRGYIWFATDKGLSRYNGYVFENFNTSDGLTGNAVLEFYPQKNGQIWCYSYHNKSLFYFDEIFKGFKPYKYNDTLKKALNERSIVKSVYLDKNDNLHIGGYQINGEVIIQKNGSLNHQFSSKYYLIDTPFQKKIVIKPLSDSPTSTFYFTSVNIDVKNTTYLCSSYTSHRIMVKWLKDNETAIFMTGGQVELISKSKEKTVIKSKYLPIDIKVIDEDYFFIGYEFGGGKIVDKNGMILKEFLSGQSVTNFLIDHEGGYWFTTLDSGVFYIPNPSTTYYNSSKNNYHHVSSLVKTNANELLIGFKNGTLSSISGSKKRFDFAPPKITAHSHVEYDSNLDRSYIFSNGKLKVNKNGNVILSEYILKLSEPKNNSIFASTNGAYFAINEKENVSTFLCPYRIQDVCVWKGDTLIATPLGIFHVKNNAFISFTNKSQLFGYRSDDIDVNDQTNTLYAATQGVGIIITDGMSIDNITESDGLSSNIVNEVHIENDSTLWVCTNRGINRIEWKKKGIHISSMDKKDGLLSNEVNDLEIINDTVWVGTKQGLCSFSKNQMNSKAITIPDLILKDLKVNGIALSSFEKASFANDENVIDIVMEGISFAHNDDITYYYRLNKNQDWVATKNRALHFSPLPSGDYTFEAKMCIDDQNCSKKIVQYSFTIRAPFWQRWWFILICIGLVGLLIYTFFKIRVLTYNKDVIRELIRLIIKKLKKDELYFTFRENGNEIRIKTHEILYIKSAGNYIDVYIENKTFTVRMNIGKFLDLVPDKLEYVRLHRSYIVRIDKITTKSKNEVELINGTKIPVSQNHHQGLKEIVF